MPESREADEIRYVCPIAGLGAGINRPAFEEAMRSAPDFVAVDAGTIDAGPFALGAGRGAFAEEAIHHDLMAILSLTPEGCPVLIGSAGTAGADIHVDWTLGILDDVARALGRHLRVAVIRAEQSKDYIKARLAAGEVAPLQFAPEYDAAAVDRSTRIVGMMGSDPLEAALRQNPDVIIAGRCSDAALFAAYPVLHGMDPGVSWHAGKVIECGTLACEVYRKGAMIGRIRGDHAIITPVGEGLRCTVQSIAAHSLYENGDPYLHAECAGTLDLTDATYEQYDSVSVKIAGARFRPAERYSVKLEGVEQLGFQSVVVGGVRDPLMVGQIDTWLAEVEADIEAKIESFMDGRIARGEWRLDVHVYGRDAVMGQNEPRRPTASHEVGLVLAFTAPTQALANKLAEISRSPLLHHPIPQWSGCITGFACLFNPAYVERGPIWTFNVNHVVFPKTPLEMFRTEWVEIGEGAAK